MRFTIKQKIMAFGKQYRVFDEAGNEVYEIRSELFSPDRRKEVLDAQGNQLGWVQWPVLSGEASFHAGLDSARIDIPLISLSPQWQMDMSSGQRYTIQGDFFRLGFSVDGAQGTVASVEKRLLAFSDTYELELDQRALPVSFALLLVALIDHKYHSDKN